MKADVKKTLLYQYSPDFDLSLIIIRNEMSVTTFFFSET